MGFSTFKADEWLLYLGTLAALSSIIVLAFSKHRKIALLDRLRDHRRRTSGASTPPRSFSPGQKDHDPTSTKETTTSTLSTVDYSKVFPPSRRSVISELPKEDLSSNAELFVDVKPSIDALLENTLPTTRVYDLDNDIPKYTPTGFSTLEIKALGDFPAYDVLSGVPLPQPYLGFDPKGALARPYRPFRWNYHQTMSLTRMEPDWWLEIESTYVSRVNERKELFKKYGSKVLDFLPGSELACKELMEMCLQFYCSRYPACFSLSADKKTFYNNILKEETILESTHPLHIVLNNIPEDFAIMLRNEKDGMYYFRAGVICSSLGWNVGTKIGKQLKDIHETIPDYKEKLSFSMDRFFSKMPTNAPIQRASWGLEVGTPLFMPQGDPHEKLRDAQREDLTIDECYLRVDWQTLRRLALSGAIVFNFKAVFTPVTEFRDEPYIPALLLRILKDGNRKLMDYKNTWHVEHVCVPELERYDREQVGKGLVKPTDGKEAWEATTLEESPYYPGWEAKWHRQQGF